MPYRLAEAKPEVKEAFKRVNIEHPESGEFSSHSVRILNGLDMIINMMDNPEAMQEALRHLAHQHFGHANVRKEHFKVSNVLQKTLVLPVPIWQKVRVGPPYLNGTSVHRIAMGAGAVLAFPF